jgi:hypothetical protein
MFLRIGFDLELLCGSAPTIHGDNPRNGQQTAADDPILDGAQIDHTEVLRTDDLVTENLSGGTILLNLGCLISGERDVLLQGRRGLAIGEVVIDAVFEKSRGQRPGRRTKWSE